MVVQYYKKSLLSLLGATILSGCYSLPQGSHYSGPSQRPLHLEEYYSKGNSYDSFKEEIIREERKYKVKRITLETWAGPTIIDYFQRQHPSDELVLVFPVLGGRKNPIENHFASYFAKHGYETAIVHRSEDFKNPNNFLELEDLFRKNVIRDRIALDFFEKEYGKKSFGSFGISRGAINVAMTAGVEPRLAYNVLVMGGTDIVGMFKISDQRRIGLYRKNVMASLNISEDEFYTKLEDMLKTDPKYLATYMDARNTLLILSLLDKTVPIKYGQKLRRQLGHPRTVYLAANHYTSILYTQFIKVFPPVDPLCIFPLEYVETEAMDFYDKSFKQKESPWRLLPIKILKAPIDFVAYVIDWVF